MLTAGTQKLFIHCHGQKGKNKNSKGKKRCLRKGGLFAAVFVFEF